MKNVRQACDGLTWFVAAMPGTPLAHALVVPSLGPHHQPDLHAHVVLDARLPLAPFKAVVEHPCVAERVGARFAYSTRPVGATPERAGGFLAYAVAQCDERVTGHPSFAEGGRRGRTRHWERWPYVISRLPKRTVAEAATAAREADDAQRQKRWGGRGRATTGQRTLSDGVPGGLAAPRHVLERMTRSETSDTRSETSDTRAEHPRDGGNLP